MLSNLSLLMLVQEPNKYSFYFGFPIIATTHSQNWAITIVFKINYIGLSFFCTNPFHQGLSNILGCPSHQYY